MFNQVVSVLQRVNCSWTPLLLVMLMLLSQLRSMRVDGQHHDTCCWPEQHRDKAYGAVLFLSA
jgi:hypothetical protein